MQQVPTSSTDAVKPLGRTKEPFPVNPLGNGETGRLAEGSREECTGTETTVSRELNKALVHFAG
jgi:hypothetical protein